MLPTELIRAASLASVRGPAILFPSSEWQETFLVTGGQHSIACFLSGSHRHAAFPIEAAERWQGYAIEGVELRVDLSSVYEVNRAGPILGSLIISDEGLHIVGNLNRGGWSQPEMLLIGDGSAESIKAGGIRVGFTQWNAFRVRHNDEFRIYEHRCDSQT